MSTDPSTRGMWRVVAQREASVQVRQKSFRWSTVISVLGVVLFVVGLHWFQGRDQDRTVAVVDAEAAAIVSSAADVARAADDRVSVESEQHDDVAAAEDAVRDGDADAALVLTTEGWEVVGDRDVDSTLSTSLSVAARSAALEANASAQDVDLAALESGAAVGERLLDPTADESGTRQAVSFVFVLLFFLTAIGFGMAIAGSVTQEKESRVVEILAAAVPIRQLLWGKIAANTVLAVGQVVLYAVAGVAALLATGQRGVLDVVGTPLLWYVLFFLVGFVALASLWSVAGSLASRQQDLQSTTLPAQLLVMGPYFLAVLGGEQLKTIFSMVPVVSSMMMPARMAETDVPWWQVAVALGGTVLAAIVLVRIGARVYERTLLRTGDKISYREALRLAE
ncbi:ABC transporter permease [Aeromicrobium sp. IC_218]|uniref:ABC transporter permease n=1 Tax=Aeromicrobium sp. IC_218 TaxID=2545468 RepID=UPI00103B77FB|nr:ABC transporter permease [Aeromicrobium sp. IC_218]TCI99705.1 ABC transporter permease [Aeromicrobium sp. IC_218]